MMKFVLTLLFLLTATPAWAQLALSDFVVPTGRETVAVAIVPVIANIPTNGDLEVSRPIVPTAGILILDNGYQVDHIRRTTGSGQGDVRIWGTDLPRSDTTFGAGETHADAFMHVQTAANGVAVYLPTGVQGGTFSNWHLQAGSTGTVIDNIVGGSEFLLAFTIPSTDNCNIYWGSQDLTAPSQLRFGATTPVRAYWGSTLVCGDQP